MKHNVDIYVNDEYSGILAHEDDRYIYTYQPKASKVVSVTMPIRHESWRSKKLHPIFQMNLPEGVLKERIKTYFSKLKVMDDLGMLTLIGPYVIGRVRYGIAADTMSELQLEDILHSDSQILFETLMDKFMLRSGVSGVQPKILLELKDKTTMSTDQYIVKSWGEEYPELALNEYFCMQACKSAGLEVPEYYLSENRMLLVLKRFDLSDKYGFLGFEDGCVLLGKGTDEKYHASYEALAKAIRSSVMPSKRHESMKFFFTALIMNHFLRNGDGHLKNYGILYAHDYTDAVMAPIFDVVCTTVYLEKDIPALKLSDGKLWWDEMTYRRFAKLTCKLKDKEIDEIITKCAKAVLEVSDEMYIYAKQKPETSDFLSKMNQEWSKGLSSFELSI